MFFKWQPMTSDLGSNIATEIFYIHLFSGKIKKRPRMANFESQVDTRVFKSAYGIERNWFTWPIFSHRVCIRIFHLCESSYGPKDHLGKY